MHGMPRIPTKAQVRELCDEVLAKGGDRADIQLAVMVKWNITIGQGGTGNIESWPECRYCGAYGGGGHGGFCPGA